MTVPTETELLQRARQLDRQTLTDIYDRYSPGLYRYALRLLGAPELAEECVSETFMRFLQHLRAGRGPRDYLQAYLYRIAHNWVVDLYRKHVPEVELDESRAGDAPTVEDAAIRSVRMKTLRTAIRRLTTDQQMVVVLKFVEGWENEDISRALGKPVGAVKSLQHRALESLKRILAGQKNI
jgi:RNA polymerase sigma-70 factor (ECF subfamily)